MAIGVPPDQPDGPEISSVARAPDRVGARVRHREDLLDEALESFPASDPPSPARPDPAAVQESSTERVSASAITQRMRHLAGEIVRLQTELDREIHRRRDALGWQIRHGLVEFERDVAARHRELRLGLSRFLAGASFSSIVTAPIIYSLIVPLMILDLWMTIYQAICFRAYGIPSVRRSDYILFDRGRLSYLNIIEALNCLYCGYGNGVISYVREIASRTEQYWCPIKHALKMSGPHRRYYEFLEYGDAEGYRARLTEFRERLRSEEPAPLVSEN
jgi:hypothetical protein